MLDVAIRRRQGSFDLDIAFQAPSQGVTALFGPSGSGKSSVINAIAGLSRPDAGHIRLDDTTLFDRDRRIAISSIQGRPIIRRTRRPSHSDRISALSDRVNDSATSRAASRSPSGVCVAV